MEKEKASIAGVWFYLKPFVSRGLQGLAGMLLALLTFDALISDWRLDPVWDILYARVKGPLFYNAHASSVLLMCLVGIYASYRMKSAVKGFAFILGMGAVHEIILAIFYIPFGSSSGITFFTIVGGRSYYGLDYGSYLLMGLGTFLLLAPAWGRRLIVYMCAFIVPYYFMCFFLYAHGIIGETVDGFALTRWAYDPLNNGVEVAGWLGICLIGLMPKSLASRPIPFIEAPLKARLGR